MPAVIVVLFPTLDIQATTSKPEQIVIQIEDLPETQQITRPPPPRPALPIETESDDVPDDVTIETTDLELEDVPVNLPPPPPPAGGELAPFEEEEILDVWKVEQKPRLIRRAWRDPSC